MIASTHLNQIEITANGVIQVRLEKRLTNNGVVMDSKWHRSAFAPGDDIDAQAALINAHLAAMGYPVIPDADLDKIKAHAQTAWTPEVVTTFRQTSFDLQAIRSGHK